MDVGPSVQWEEAGLAWRLSTFMQRERIDFAVPMVTELASWRGLRGHGECSDCHFPQLSAPSGSAPYWWLERIMGPWPVVRVAVCEAIRHHYAHLGISPV